MNKIANDIFYVGVNDHIIDLFEGQYIVPNGISYNSYLIIDDKIAVMDTVDGRKCEEWLNNLEEALSDKKPDYLVLLHMEPDHTGSLRTFLEKYPNTQVVSNAKLFNMIPQFFEGLDLEGFKVVVGDGDTLALGTHTLKFIMAPMVHWPEVMMAYEEKEKILLLNLISLFSVFSKILEGKKKGLEAIPKTNGVLFLSYHFFCFLY